jgi:hypothetical protein
MRRLGKQPHAGMVNALALICSTAVHAGSLQVTSSAAFSGTLGLEVMVDSSCTAEVDVTVAPGTFEGTVQACRSITATGVEVVGAGASFVAGDWIELGEGFTVGNLPPFDAAIESSLYPFAFVRDLSPSAESAYVAEFALRLDSLTLAAGDRLVHFTGNDAGGDPRFQLILEHGDGQNRLVLGAREDSGTVVETPAAQHVVLPAGWNEIAVTYETGVATGSVQVALNGVPQGGLTGLSNAAGLIEFADWGAVDGVFTGTSGTLELDEFRSTR